MRTLKRKILSIDNGITRVNGAVEVKFKRVVWCLPTSETSRTYRTTHVAVSYYINGKFKGIDARMPRKPISINKRNPLASRWLVEGKYVEYMTKDAFNDAFNRYLTSLSNLKGKVNWFDRSSGHGTIEIESLGLILPVYACNLKGKKTWFAETACMYLDDKQEVNITRLGEVDRGVTPIIDEGVKFDAEKWTSLDQSRLAFKCDDEGNAINGLFATKTGA